MGCPVCGWSGRAGAHRSCAICGFTGEKDASTWDRAAEASAACDVRLLLTDDESLLGITRGQLVGDWRHRASAGPRALLWRWANLALTSHRVIVQPVGGTEGAALGDAHVAAPLAGVASVSLSDADALEPGRTARVVVDLRNGQRIRLRASGRLADAARQLVAVYRTLSDSVSPAKSSPISCEACGRGLERPHAFCPFCGAHQGEA